MLPLLVCAILACEKYSITRYYRSEVMDAVGAGGNPPGKQDPPDVDLYVSAVVVPDDYDWRRDTAYGAVESRLAFFRNGECLFSVPAGLGSDISVKPSTHHIMNGHLYTECVSGGSTVIMEDGKEVLRYDGAEVLRGMIMRPGEIITLGKPLGADGFCLRRNGEVRLRHATGAVYGDFSDYACGATGALYDDNGEVCFCFRDDRYCYTVMDEETVQVRMSGSATSVTDMRIVESGLYYILHYSRATMVYGPWRTISLSGSAQYSDLRIAGTDGSVLLFAETCDPEQTVVRDISEGIESERWTVFDGKGNFVYRAGGPFFAVSSPDGLLRIQKEGEGDIFLRDSSFFFGRACAVPSGDGIYLAVNPKERECLPYVWHSGKEDFFDFNGFLTGLAVSPPN